MTKSIFINTITLLQNAYEYVQLKQTKRELLDKKAALKDKIKNYKSESSIKKAIREDIRLIDKNEILLRLP
ncbi:MAG: hypothetical protein MK033_00920 [Candidatus Caenarcaniphilales bacterium]|nr:hypothetical protein [Candidatus Caenarcaniphilales bacterium]